MSFLSWIIPDWAWPLVIVGLAGGLMVGLLTLRTLVGVLVTALVLPMVLSPFIEAAFGAVPPWVSLLALAVVGLILLRGIAGLVLGRQAADHMVGSLAASLVRVVLVWAVAVLLFPVRALGFALRRPMR